MQDCVFNQRLEQVFEDETVQNVFVHVGFQLVTGGMGKLIYLDVFADHAQLISDGQDIVPGSRPPVIPVHQID
jgi:hypothetical protein